MGASGGNEARLRTWSSVALVVGLATAAVGGWLSLRGDSPRHSAHPARHATGATTTSAPPRHSTTTAGTTTTVGATTTTAPPWATCERPDLHFAVRFPPEWTTPATGDNHCVSFTSQADPESARVHMQVEAPTEQTFDELVTSFDNPGDASVRVTHEPTVVGGHRAERGHVVSIAGTMRTYSYFVATDNGGRPVVVDLESKTSIDAAQEAVVDAIAATVEYR